MRICEYTRTETIYNTAMKVHVLSQIATAVSISVAMIKWPL